MIGTNLFREYGGQMWKLGISLHRPYNVGIFGFHKFESQYNFKSGCLYLLKSSTSTTRRKLSKTRRRLTQRQKLNPLNSNMN